MNDEGLGFINSLGKEIVPTKYNEIEKFGELHPEWALVKKDDLCGFINTSGKEIVNPQYEKIESGEKIEGVNGNKKSEIKKP